MVSVSVDAWGSSAGVGSVDIPKIIADLYARFISRWKYRFSSDQRSQATLSSVSTGVGDQPGTLSDLAFFTFIFF
jgi:hypothetical protein